MAYIAPNTSIRLVKTKLDPNYENTIYFASREAQSSYFLGLRPIQVFAANSYQRKNKNTIRLNASYAAVYDYNYMSFINNNFEGKYFYAFITKIEYVNNATVEIEYKLDVMQTWLFDYTLGECFVEREHAARDYVGDNLLPEPISVTDWSYTSFARCPVFDPASSLYNLTAVVLATTESLGALLPAENFDTAKFTGSKVFNGLYLSGFLNPSESVTPTPDLNTVLRQLVSANKISSVIAIFMCPAAFVPIFRAGDSGFYLDRTHMQNPYNWTIPKQNAWTYSFGGKTGPRNNKLYTFQFNKLIVSDNDEATAEYPYEYFVGSQTDCEFTIYGSVTPNPEFACIPRNFKGGYNSYMHQLISHGYPQCSWVSDAYQQWLAQNKYKLAFGFAGAAVGSGVGVARAATSGVADVGATALGSAVVSKTLSTLSEMLTVESLPPQLQGTVGQNVNIESEAAGFGYYYATAIPQVLAMADDFFDMYGYKTCSVKQPNIHVRQNWTYTKTNGCIILPNQNASVPVDDAREIEAIFDKGIRFWTNGANIGNYSLSNLCL